VQKCSHLVTRPLRSLTSSESLVCEYDSNEDALQFYLSHGFEQVGKIENYYKRIEPPDCFILEKKLAGKVNDDSLPPANTPTVSTGNNDSNASSVQL